jgi:hypothetical protein
MKVESLKHKLLDRFGFPLWDSLRDSLRDPTWISLADSIREAIRRQARTDRDEG